MAYASAFGRNHGLAWVLPLVGAWTIVSPWVVSVSGEVDTVGVVWNNVAVGAVFLLLGLATAAVSMRGDRSGRSAR